MDKGRISSMQMGMMMYLTIIATAILTVPSITAKYAKKDLWISPIWASIIGFITVIIVMQLSKRFPRQSFFQICEQTIGTLATKLLGFLYFTFFLIASGQITRTYAEFIKVFFIKTPVHVIIITMLLLSAFTVIAGIEVIGRVSQLVFPIFIFSVFIIIFLLLPQLEPSNIFPIVENGLLPSLKGAIIPQIWFGELFLMVFLLPSISDSKGMKWGIITVLLILVTFILINITVLFILNQNTEFYIYPFLSATQLVNLGDFIESIDPIIIAIWILGTFIKITVFYNATIFTTAQWLKLSDYKPIVWPIGILIVEVSFWGVPNLMVNNHIDIAVFPLLFPIMQTFIPFFILMVAVLRKKSKSLEIQ
ncbi:endospore germination permease [Cytobacillus sp.]|uniref:GerAB/ArcD/ProY family transporter n=1 Tax=Cytobacillus sp. TaxID=2675269 RepID=UPI0028BE7D26|nr:endospore germination permease [Cytobacillus sp.]